MGPRSALLSLLACTSTACGLGAEPPPVVELATTEGLDADVVALARKHIAAARLQPKDPKLRANLALVYEANELWEEGVRAWSDAVALDPDQPVWSYHRAICLQQHGDTAGALTELRGVVARVPDLPAARHRLGEMLLDADDVEGARVEYESAIRLVDYAPDPYIGLAEVMMRQGNDARAAELCQRALALDPGSRRAHYDLGLAYRGLGRMAEAEAELNKGLNASKRFLSDPLTVQLDSYREGFSVRFSEAARLKKEGNPQAAVTILESLLKRHPKDVLVLNNLGGSLIDLGRAQAALPHLLKAKEIDPTQFATYVNLAGAHLALKNYPEALVQADKAVELAPKLAQAHALRATIFLETGRSEEAYTELKTAVGLDASSGQDFGRLGQVSIQLGRVREAVGYYETAARLLPDSLPAQAGLANVYFRVGEQAKALAAFERARKLAPDSPQVRALGLEIGAPVR